MALVIPYTFVPAATILSSQVNANFAAISTWVSSQVGLTAGSTSVGSLSVTGTWPNQVINVGPFVSNNYASWYAAVTAIGTATHVWPLKDTSGTVATDVIAGSNGTYVGSPSLAQPLGRQTGVGLSGTGQYVTLPTIELPITAPWSVECYAAFTSSSNGSQLYAFSADEVSMAATFNSGTAYTTLKSFGGASADPLLTVTTSYLQGGLSGQGGQITVDSSGDVLYVSYNSGTPQLIKYTPNGTLTVIAATLPGTPTGAIAQDSSGNIYLGASSATSIWKYSPAGTLLSTITISGVTHTLACLAINQSTGEIWALDCGLTSSGSAYLLKFAATGGAPTVTITLAASGYSFLTQIAVDSAGSVYSTLSATSVAKYPAAGGSASLTITGLTSANTVGIQIDASNNIWLGGGYGSGAGLLKYSSSGTLLATYLASGFLYGSAGGFAQDASGNNYYYAYAGPYIAKYGPIPTIVSLSLSNTATVAPIHYVTTYDGTTLRFYINGVMVASSAATIATSPGLNAVIGSYNYPPGTTPWQGVIANVAIYNTALTGAQISSLYNAL